MPAEFRFILFTPQEAAQALVKFCQKSGRKLPIATVVAAEPVGGVAGEEPPRGLLRLLPDSGEEVQLKFEPQEIVGALLLFALDRKIPMPRDSEKVLESIRNRFALRIGYYPVDGGTPAKAEKAEKAKAASK
ncbi:MAG: hypothetical protein P1U88_13485 [Thalassobaculaceae bacterium]|nr:hypothetical protein [Thalassobaculaceae bacterium]